ncbi:MAG: hypothetical protein OEY44_01860, partial [Candidatus Peregrinibacteria bacterium]|nr:hypothetical protein [Candidatus Peregrinibacteria bacterium]
MQNKNKIINGLKKTFAIMAMFSLTASNAHALIAFENASALPVNSSGIIMDYDNNGTGDVSLQFGNDPVSANNASITKNTFGHLTISNGDNNLAEFGSGGHINLTPGTDYDLNIVSFGAGSVNISDDNYNIFKILDATTALGGTPGEFAGATTLNYYSNYDGWPEVSTVPTECFTDDKILYDNGSNTRVLYNCDNGDGPGGATDTLSIIDTSLYMWSDTLRSQDTFTIETPTWLIKGDEGDAVFTTIESQLLLPTLYNNLKGYPTVSLVADLGTCTPGGGLPKYVLETGSLHICTATDTWTKQSYFTEIFQDGITTDSDLTLATSLELELNATNDLQINSATGDIQFNTGLGADTVASFNSNGSIDFETTNGQNFTVTTSDSSSDIVLDGSYIIDIDADVRTEIDGKDISIGLKDYAAYGSINLTGGGGTDTYQVTINGNTGSVIPFTTNLTTTASLIAADITNNITGYSATSDISNINITADTPGLAGNGVINVTLVDNGGSPSASIQNMTGGANNGNVKIGDNLGVFDSLGGISFAPSADQNFNVSTSGTGTVSLTSPTWNIDGAGAATLSTVQPTYYANFAEHDATKTDAQIQATDCIVEGETFLANDTNILYECTNASIDEWTPQTITTTLYSDGLMTNTDLLFATTDGDASFGTLSTSTDDVTTTIAAINDGTGAGSIEILADDNVDVLSSTWSVTSGAASGFTSISSTGNITSTGGDLVIGSIGLNDTTPASEGATLVGVDPTAFAYSSSTTVMGVLDDLDQTIGTTIQALSTAPGSCAEGDVYYDTTSSELFICTATDTWSNSGPQDFEDVYATDAGNDLVTGNSDFVINTGTGILTLDSTNWNITASGNANFSFVEPTHYGNLLNFTPSTAAAINGQACTTGVDDPVFAYDTASVYYCIANVYALQNLTTNIYEDGIRTDSDFTIARLGGTAALATFNSLGGISFDPALNQN